MRDLTNRDPSEKKLSWKSCFLTLVFGTWFWLLVQIPVAFVIITKTGGLNAFLFGYGTEVERHTTEIMKLCTPFLAYMVFVTIVLWMHNAWTPRFRRILVVGTCAWLAAEAFVFGFLAISVGGLSALSSGRGIDTETAAQEQVALMAPLVLYLVFLVILALLWDKRGAKLRGSSATPRITE